MEVKKPSGRKDGRKEGRKEGFCDISTLWHSSEDVVVVLY